jgi:hypothetical protein
MTDDIVMNPSVRKALWQALLLLLAGCAPSLPEHGDNPQELRQRDVELDYWSACIKQHWRTKISLTTRVRLFHLIRAPNARATMLARCMDYQASTR